MDLYVERLKPSKGGGESVKITANLRVQIWELYIGKGIKRATCPLCGLNELLGPAQNSGFQACHVVASKFSPAASSAAPTGAAGKSNESTHFVPPLSTVPPVGGTTGAAGGAANIFYLFPGCQTCNNECAEQCLLDFLYTRLRYKQLRAFIWSVFSTYTTLHEGELAQHEGLCWRVLDHLYGPKRFPAGGGIENRWAIYQLANAEQLKHLNEDIKQLSAQLSQRITLVNTLTSTEIKSTHLI